MLRRLALLTGLLTCLLGTYASADTNGPGMSPEATEMGESASASLSGTSWRFVEVSGALVPASIEASITFGSDGRTASGHGGCNSFFGGYVSEKQGSMLAFNDLGWTKMFCPGPGPEMRTEITIQSVLAKTRSYAVVEKELNLFGDDKAVIARLAPTAP